MFHFRPLLPRTHTPLAGALLALVCLVGWQGGARAQIVERDFAPGFGLIYGEGRTQEGGDSKRFGFTSRRMKDKDRMGSLNVIYEEHTNGLPFDVLKSDLPRENVELRYRSIFAEIKRFFPLGGSFHIYWGLRGGFTRINVKVDPGDSQPAQEFEEDQVAPLWLLALPLALEHPGFLLLAFVDGGSVGITYDIVPERFWLEYQLSAAIIPRHRDQFVALDDLTLTTQTLQLVLVF